MPFLTSGRSRFIGGGRVPPTPVPVAGAELIVNGDFAAWTGDNPDGWSVFETGNGIVSENPAGQCQIVSGGDGAGITQTIFAASAWHIVGVDVNAISGTLSLNEAGVVVMAPITTTGSKLLVHRTAAAPGTFQFFRDGTMSAQIDNVTCKAYSLSSLISTRSYASADCDISVAVTRTAGTQAGISARVDSAASPANFLIAYLDGSGNVKVDKCVSGTYTNVISGAVTYGAGRILRLVCNGNNVSVYYNGTQVGSTTAVADAGIVGNKNHGLFSTYSANTFSGYVAA